ncbi:MAG: anaerobic ribonucleoside-triphosphate reductase activating protein [Rickettsiales bacterium]|jgi:anaerobic ribonucleoside-triphosphate reductase activating protein|nr:anaerobic ribonucleoside-triphosphate reductase activating protein [Rickettsiales bacterium]
MASSKIIVGGLVPFTTIDYPGKVAMVVFLQGCPWRCVYCSNPHLFEARQAAEQDIENWQYVLDMLSRRTKVIDAVVFSGGEATMQSKEVANAIADIHFISPDFKIGLHTNGCLPDAVEDLLPLVDWVGLDIKAPARLYEDITCVPGSAEAAFRSLDLLLKSCLPFEVRTTADPRVLDKEAILELASLLSRLGVRNYAVQRYRPVDKNADGVPSSADIMQFFTDTEFEAKLRAMFEKLTLRW